MSTSSAVFRCNVPDDLLLWKMGRFRASKSSQHQNFRETMLIMGYCRHSVCELLGKNIHFKHIAKLIFNYYVNGKFRLHYMRKKSNRWVCFILNYQITSTNYNHILISNDKITDDDANNCDSKDNRSKGKICLFSFKFLKYNSIISKNNKATKGCKMKMGLPGSGYDGYDDYNSCKYHFECGLIGIESTCFDRVVNWLNNHVTGKVDSRYTFEQLIQEVGKSTQLNVFDVYLFEFEFSEILYTNLVIKSKTFVNKCWKHDVLIDKCGDNITDEINVGFNDLIQIVTDEDCHVYLAKNKNILGQIKTNIKKNLQSKDCVDDKFDYDYRYFPIFLSNNRSKDGHDFKMLIDLNHQFEIRDG